MDLIILLPAKNEGKSIGKVIDEIPLKRLKAIGLKTNIIVIDGHSTDNTCKIAKSKGARVIVQDGVGKGMAFQTILKKLKKRTPDVLVMIDSDYTYDPRDIPKVIKPLIKGEADVVIGSRLKGNESSFKRINLFGNKILTLIANLLYKTKTSDLCTGCWVFSKEAVKRLDVKADGFDLEADLFVNVNKQGFKLKSVPISYRQRIGDSKLGLSTALLILKRLIKKTN